MSRECRHERQRALAWGAAWVAGFLLAGCTPAAQPKEKPDAGQGIPQPQSAWVTVLAAAEAGQRAHQYMIRIDVQSQQGALHSSFSAYGAINRPDRVSIDLLNQGTDLYFYQQGGSAYYRQDGHWSPAPALTDTDAYQGYVRAIQSGMQQKAPLVQLPRVYVNDEYCDVYQATLSGQNLWPGGVSAGDAALVWPVQSGQMGNVLYTFYVGQRDHLLRRVDAESVSTVRQIGTVQVDATTVFFDIDQPAAKITLPKDLVKQLENVD
ncbi:hypothetical protein [Alicyclobacillus macrosporangiidus]|uniref:hypothetical protein n=1 Tax=Alicyclobacillus macrosporangiidus TaxID=392015 RepID=UPI0004962A33|nr:hypothetical protein [Alicyclobacillus macrosporangiidus]